jgi:hypothetical protein
LDLQYSVVPPRLTYDRLNGLGISGTLGTAYRIEFTLQLTGGGNWLPVSTNTILANGFNQVLANPATNELAKFYRAVWLP